MTPTALLTRDGRKVTSVAMPPFAIPPEVIAWGDRIFIRNDFGEYREGVAWVVTDWRTMAL